MGSGIAIVMARVGHRTILFDVDRAGLQRGIDTVHGFFDNSVRKGKLTPDQAAAAKNALIGMPQLPAELKGASDEAPAPAHVALSIMT